MLDKIDNDILSLLKDNSRMSFRQIAKKLRLHPTTVISRISRLEKTGIITGYSVHLDLSKLGYEFMGMVQVKISKGKLVETQEKISTMKGVIAVYDVTGEYDSVVIVAAKTRDSFSSIIKSFLQLPYVEHTNTQVILKIVKPSHHFEAL
ncbi:MAG: Lrp/AsnC family transcriptional regulator [Candidatus Anstonellaceae archaeon]